MTIFSKQVQLQLTHHGIPNGILLEVEKEKPLDLSRGYRFILAEAVTVELMFHFES